MPKNTPARSIDTPYTTDSNGGYITPGAGRTPQAGAGGTIAVGWLPNGHGRGIDADTLDGLHGAGYALLAHTHDERYALLAHTHDERYALLTHTHDERYALLTHTHDERYALLTHTHDGTGVTLALDDLTDVDAALPALGALLTWSGTTWEPIVPDPIVVPEVADDAIWNAKGDLAVGIGADSAARLGAGSNGQVLTADSTQTTGLKWATPAPALSLPTAQQTIPTNDSRYYYLCHWYNNLHVRFGEASSDSDLRIYCDGTLIYTSPGSGGNHNVNLDLSSVGLTVGAIYQLRLRASNDDVTEIFFVGESSSSL
jgi:hypothetical protein